MQIIKLQPRRLLHLTAGSLSETQIEPMAANISGFRFVTPFVRLLRDPANSYTAGAITFNFLTAAMLANPNDSSGGLASSIARSLSLQARPSPLPRQMATPSLQELLRALSVRSKMQVAF